ncbi:hypothetical protein ACFOLA_11500 [Salinicoccus hispanicus]|uniref:Uncharacterized protein n=1 Tax=Salinicoccus hispanicus TaxID=157225 RepID=A0A6N8U3V5_9STAP|nr:hypothetical protein [Salinicoccus hispanicus]MXQ50901.1 hypothetical protein [Salinicoccus hispanicus]
MRVPLSQVTKYLFKPHPGVDIKYLEHDISGETEVTEFLTPNQLESLEPEARKNHSRFLNDINGKVRDQIRTSNFYRFASIALLILFIILPGLILFFLGGSHWALIGGVYYAFFAYLLVEAYIQANSNYFEYTLYEQFEKEYIK